jgi:hypothetical protein
MENFMLIDARAARTSVLESRLYRVQNQRGAPQETLFSGKQ